jgi:hypothetical protein
VTATSDIDEKSHTTNESAKNKTDTAEHFYICGTKWRNWKCIKKFWSEKSESKKPLRRTGLGWKDNLQKHDGVLISP